MILKKAYIRFCPLWKREMNRGFFLSPHLICKKHFCARFVSSPPFAVKRTLQLFQRRTVSEISLADMVCAPKFPNRFSRDKASASPSGVCQTEKLPGNNVHVKGERDTMSGD
jgi:hypothetical protein